MLFSPHSAKHCFGYFHSCSASLCVGASPQGTSWPASCFSSSIWLETKLVRKFFCQQICLPKFSSSLQLKQVETTESLCAADMLSEERAIATAKPGCSPCTRKSTQVKLTLQLFPEDKSLTSWYAAVSSSTEGLGYELLVCGLQHIHPLARSQGSIYATFESQFD